MTQVNDRVRNRNAPRGTRGLGPGCAWLTLWVTAWVVLGAPTRATASARWGVAVFPSGAEFALEFAEDEQARRRGYMFRESVGPREGMLFRFEESGHHGIWMKNCLVALDIIWLDTDFRVVHVVHALPPCPREGDCPVSLPARAARYVLEVAAGTAAKEKLAPGDRVVVLAEPGLR